MMKLVVVAVATLLMGAQPSHAAPTDAQQCASKKIKAAGKYGQCRMKASAKAAKTGGTADFTKCDAKLSDAFLKVETQYGPACPTTGDATAVQTRVAADALEIACDLQSPLLGTGASVAIVDNLQVTASSDATLAVVNVSNAMVHAHCFYATASCTVTDFVVTLSAQGTVTWQALAGSVANLIPPIPETPFDGEMVCVEVDASDTPVQGNHIYATRTAPGQCPLAQIGVLAGDGFSDGDAVLSFGGTSDIGVNEYESCPASIPETRIESCWSFSPFTFVCE
jgi:hypothetical protein